MSDKERLKHIEEQVQDLLTLADSEGYGEANLLAIYNDMIWLIEQAEKVERYEKALREIDTNIRATPEPVPHIIETLKCVLPEYNENKSNLFGGARNESEGD